MYDNKVNKITKGNLPLSHHWQLFNSQNQILMYIIHILRTAAMPGEKKGHRTQCQRSVPG